MKRKKWYRLLTRWLRRRGRPTARPRIVPTQHGTVHGVKGAKKKPRLIPRRVIAFLMICIVGASFAFSFYRFDRLILPLVLEAEELRIQAEINNVINRVVKEIITERNVTAQDFIIQHLDGPNPVLSVNTVLVNDISNAAAQRISEMLNNLEPETVYVPMGMALGLDTLAQTGPRFSFTLAPIGNALVFHESRFIAVGINQIHFSVWLTVESIVRIINPVHSSEIMVVRNVSLVDTVISGTVPDAYLHMDALGRGFGTAP